jgi:hypothetical protein
MGNCSWLDGLQILLGICEEEKNLRLPGVEPRPSSSYPAAAKTEPLLLPLASAAETKYFEFNRIPS